MGPNQPQQTVEITQELVQRAETTLDEKTKSVVQVITALANTIQEQTSKGDAAAAAINSATAIANQAAKFDKLNESIVEDIKKARVKHIQTTQAGASALRNVAAAIDQQGGGSTFDRLTA